MRKNRLLSLLLTAVMTGAAALSLASCSSDSDDSGNSNNPAQQYNLAGTWMAEYDVMGTVGGSQMEYSRLISRAMRVTSSTRCRVPLTLWQGG